MITGVAGGEFKTRGHLIALDARTGKEVWRFYTVPAPGERGFETWPQTGNAWKSGGAAVWQTPSADPKLGLLYFSTGNAGPDDDGAVRPGANLFSVSIVALNIKTGKLRWYYQMVHHDLWDYDAPSPTVLFDAMIHGKLVHGIGEAPKTGFVYLLDRTNGKPIYPIPEKPVPQEADQATYPTQPFPSLPPALAIQVPTPDQVAEIVKARERSADGDRATSVYALQEHDDGDGAGTGGRDELGALELRSGDAPHVRVRTERRRRHDRR